MITPMRFLLVFLSGMFALAITNSGITANWLANEFSFMAAPGDATKKSNPSRPELLNPPNQTKKADGKSAAPANKNSPPAAQKKDPPKSPLMRALYDQIENYNDKELENKEELRRQLREADELYLRAKAQNKEGIRRANNPPKRVLSSTPKKSEKKADPKPPAPPAAETKLEKQANEAET